MKPEAFLRAVVGTAKLRESFAPLTNSKDDDGWGIVVPVVAQINANLVFNPVGSTAVGMDKVNSINEALKSTFSDDIKYKT